MAATVQQNFGMISIHAAREGGDDIKKYAHAVTLISIHAAREGGDAVLINSALVSAQFQSTPPVKAATFASNPTYEDFGISIHAAREGGDRAAKAAFKFFAISIHAAREGGDISPRRLRRTGRDFNPRRP